MLEHPLSERSDLLLSLSYLKYGDFLLSAKEKLQEIQMNKDHTYHDKAKELLDLLHSK